MRTVIIIIVGLVISGNLRAAPRGELAVTDTGHATLTFVLHSASAEMTEVAVPIELPAGMAATGLRISTDGQEARSTAIGSSDARAEYDDIVAEIKDPALLEYRGERRAILHVFPVQRDAPATVVVELTARSLADATELEYLDRDVSLLASPELARPAREDEDSDPYADYWPSHEAPEVVIVADE